MRIERRFTRKGTGPYPGIRFEARDCEIRDPAGRVLFSQQGVTVPEDWSRLASDILAGKYFRRAGIPGKGGETDARQVFDRMAGAWVGWGRRYGYFDDDVSAEAFHDEIRFMLARQMAAPNSPQWFNTGLHEAYGIEGPPQGHYWVDPVTGRAEPSPGAHTHPQPSACFIQGVSDELVGDDGVMDLWVREARLFKHGAGSGTNFSNLRARGEALSGGGHSSGVMAFLRVGDRAAAAIQSGGTTRRAAKMVCLDADHPEIEEFVAWKANEEQKAAALVAGGAALTALACELKDVGNRRMVLMRARSAGVPEAWLRNTLLAIERGEGADVPKLDEHWEGEAYATVSGQHSNNSVRVTDEFMRAVLGGGPWALRRRGDAGVAREIEASHLWRRICAAAWASADPGLHFSTTIDAWHTCPGGGPIRASNPCSEYLFLDDTACNLASLNLARFVDAKGEFVVKDFIHACRLWTLVLEITVGMGQYPSRRIAENSTAYRTLGLGYANLGGLLMALGIAYDSPLGRATAAGLAAVMTGEAYAVSAELAAKLGPFAEYSANRGPMLRVIRAHRAALKGEGVAPLERENCPPTVLAAADAAWDRAVELGEKHGFRNAQVSAIAPTGTIGLLMDCDTTGIEPEYALSKQKKLAGGGSVRLANRSVERGLTTLGYGSAQVRAIAEHVAAKGFLSGAPHLKAGDAAVFACALPDPSGTVLTPEAQVEMVAAVQYFVSGGISKTVNLPGGSTPDEIGRVFELAWRRGVKAIAIYRDGSKLSQPLERPASPCPECGQLLLVPAGTCQRCLSCGATTGCG